MIDVEPLAFDDPPHLSTSGGSDLKTNLDHRDPSALLASPPTATDTPPVP
jgi:hypothetical protein